MNSSRGAVMVHSSIKSRLEHKAIEHLQNHSFEVWLPRKEIEKIKADERSQYLIAFLSLFVCAFTRSYINWVPNRSTLAGGASNTSTGPSTISNNFSVKIPVCL
jgi:hypothetical protein